MSIIEAEDKAMWYYAPDGTTVINPSFEEIVAKFLKPVEETVETVQDLAPEEVMSSTAQP
jgi:hypothetical protein